MVVSFLHAGVFYLVINIVAYLAANCNINVSYMCAHVCTYVYGSHACMRVEARGQPQISFLQLHSTPLIYHHEHLNSHACACMKTQPYACN